MVLAGAAGQTVAAADVVRREAREEDEIGGEKSGMGIQKHVLHDWTARLDEVRLQPRLGRPATHGTVPQPDGTATASDKLVPAAAGAGAGFDAGSHAGSAKRRADATAHAGTHRCAADADSEGSGTPDAGGPGHGARGPAEANQGKNKSVKRAEVDEW